MNPNNINTTKHQTHKPTRFQTYTVNFFNTEITTVVTSTPAVARQWVYTLRHNHRRRLANSSLVVGLGVQWCPTFGPESPSADTLQLCVDDDCLIFQLSHADTVPATLRRLLEGDGATFVGVHNGRDETLLEECCHELNVGCLVDLAKELGFGYRSMESICSEVLGFSGIVKPREISVSDWDEFWLSDDQVQYACVDAHIAYLLGVEFATHICEGRVYFEDHRVDYDSDSDSDCSYGD